MEDFQSVGGNVIFITAAPGINVFPVYAEHAAYLHL